VVAPTLRRPPIHAAVPSVTAVISYKRIFGAKNAPAAKAAGYDAKAHAAGFVSVTPAVTATAENAFGPGRASVSLGRELNTSLA
jgi:hypothetical protein